ncbi:hypothetical protein FRC17_007340 [Serendipita sp. 399]|nr:hypothetical protein FRC17_007340 [Serendipita sp. 399]
MVPPTLAYWGALQSDPEVAKDYLTKAYEQLRLYREVLRDGNTNNGLWHHVIYGSWSDPRHWTTGHGWAIAGILRVHQTIAKSALRDELSWMLPNLVSWAQEIVGAVWQYQRPDGSLYNYLDEDGSFTDMSGTAFMAAVTYRLAMIGDAAHFIPNADKALALVKNSITSDGRLKNVVNPYDFTTPYDKVSPEGNAMALMLEAAHRDYSGFQKSIHNGLSDVFSAFAKAILAAKEQEGSSN